MRLPHDPAARGYHETDWYVGQFEVPRLRT